MTHFKKHNEFNFTNTDYEKVPAGLGMKSGCTKTEDCPSDTAHLTGCLGLKTQLVRFKEDRRRFERGHRHAG